MRPGEAQWSGCPPIMPAPRAFRKALRCVWWTEHWPQTGQMTSQPLPLVALWPGLPKPRLLICIPGFCAETSQDNVPGALDVPGTQYPLPSPFTTFGLRKLTVAGHCLVVAAWVSSFRGQRHRDMGSGKLSRTHWGILPAQGTCHWSQGREKPGGSAL